jgi:lysophospholipase L1-like esterase
MKLKPFITLLLILCVFSSVRSQLSLNNKSKKNQLQESIPDSIYPSQNFVISYQSEWCNAHYQERIKEFIKMPLKHGDIVFLGNSITELGADWGTRFNSSIVKNRGISGDVTEGVLARLGEIYYFKPTSVFILIGINDIFREKKIEFSVANIIEITRDIHRYSPDTKIYVQTILPTSNPSIVAKIKGINDIIFSKQQSENYLIIDLHALFADENDIIKKEYTVDGVHLTEDGYRVWVNEVKKFIPTD